MKKIVYFAGAIRGDRSLADTMHALVSYITVDLELPVLTEHVGADDPIATFAQKIHKTTATMTARDVESQDIAWLDTATHVIAEISGASTGTGREIEYARTKGDLGKTPATILCLYRKDREFYASPMITGMDQRRYPNITVQSYQTIDEAKKIISAFLR